MKATAIIHSTIKKHLIDSQPDFEEKQRLEQVIESKLAIEFELASIRQDLCIVNFELAEKVLLIRAVILAQQMPSTDILVNMTMEIKPKALHEYLLTKCKGTNQMFKLEGNTPKISKLKILNY